jgi:hypothetical protein
MDNREFSRGLSSRNVKLTKICVTREAYLLSAALFHTVGPTLSRKKVLQNKNLPES